MQVRKFIPVLLLAVLVSIMAVDVIAVFAQDNLRVIRTREITRDGRRWERFTLGACPTLDSPAGNDISALAPLTPGDQHQIVSLIINRNIVRLPDGTNGRIDVPLWVEIATSANTCVWVDGACGQLISYR
jgi:hypothetical protein